MDVQGYEMQVLQGAMDATKSGAALVMEFCPDLLHEQGDLDTINGALSSWEFLCDLSESEPIRRSIAEVATLIGEYKGDCRHTDIPCVHSQT